MTNTSPNASPTPVDSGTGLIRGLSFTSAAALVVGSMIGTGVYLKAAVMSQLVGSPALVLAAWGAAGFLSLCGALSFAELGAMMPRAGGLYAWIRSAYGNGPAFLYGWTAAVVLSAGNSALGVGLATFLSAIIPMPGIWAEANFQSLGFHWQVGPREGIAVLAVLVFGAINCLSVAFGGRVQFVLTLAKCLGLGMIVVGAFFFADTGSPSHFTAPPEFRWTGFQAFGAAMLAALWAFDGWCFMPMAAGEVKDPGRNVPRALILGVFSVWVLYSLANLAYFWALPFSEIVSANSTLFRDALPVAAKTAQTFLGVKGPAIVSAIFMISAAGALNGVLLSIARVPFAMARDGLLPAKLGEIHPKSRVPVVSIAAVAVWSALLALSGTYDQLTDMTIFAEWIFYALAVSIVFRLRRTLPDAPRPYRTFGYPVTPAIFFCGAAFLVGNTIVTRPLESAVGLALIATGLPVYWWYRKSASRPLDTAH
ncbi:MAG: amino acid permease [Bryobacteraceae bacterium]